MERNESLHAQAYAGTLGFLGERVAIKNLTVGLAVLAPLAAVIVVAINKDIGEAWAEAMRERFLAKSPLPGVSGEDVTPDTQGGEPKGEKCLISTCNNPAVSGGFCWRHAPSGD